MEAIPRDNLIYRASIRRAILANVKYAKDIGVALVRASNGLLTQLMSNINWDFFRTKRKNRQPFL